MLAASDKFIVVLTILLLSNSISPQAFAEGEKVEAKSDNTQIAQVVTAPTALLPEGTRLKGQVSVERQSPFVLGEIQTLKKDTKIDLNLSCNLNSELSKKGDEIFARVCVDVKDGQKVMLPGGWHLHGVVSDARSQGRHGRDGYVEVTFDKLISPDGDYELPVEAKFSTRDNELKAVTKVIAGDVAHVSWGAVGGAILSAELTSIPVAIATYGISLAPGAILGAVLGGVGAVKRKGKIASLYQGEAIQLKIAEPMVLPGFNPDLIPSAARRPAIKGVDMKIGKVTFGKNPFGDKSAKQLTLDVIIDNHSNKELRLSDLVLVTEYDQVQDPSLFGSYLAFGKHVMPGAKATTTVSFSVSNRKQKYWLALMERSKNRELMRVPIN